MSELEGRCCSKAAPRDCKSRAIAAVVAEKLDCPDGMAGCAGAGACTGADADAASGPGDCVGWKAVSICAGVGAGAGG